MKTSNYDCLDFFTAASYVVTLVKLRWINSGWNGVCRARVWV